MRHDDGRALAHHAAQRRACQRWIGRQAQRVEHRRHEIHVAHGRRDHAARRERGGLGIDLRDDERHLQRALVGEHAVCQLAVVAEAFAVIGGDDHERLLRQQRQPVEERRQRGVRPGHFALIRCARVLRLPLVRRVVGRVRIEHVDPREELLRVLRRDPVERARHHDVGTALGPYAGFVSGLMLWMLGTFAWAAVSTVFASAIGLLVPGLGGAAAKAGVLVVVFAFWAAINLRGVALASRLNSIATVAKLAPLVLIGVGGLFFVRGEHLAVAQDHVAHVTHAEPVDEDVARVHLLRQDTGLVLAVGLGTVPRIRCWQK